MMITKYRFDNRRKPFDCVDSSRSNFVRSFWREATFDDRGGGVNSIHL